MSLVPCQHRYFDVIYSFFLLVLTEDAAQIASGEEDTARPIMALETRLLSKVRCNGIDLHRLGSDQAHARLLIPIHTAHARTKVALAKVRVRERAFLGGIERGDQLVSWDVVVEQPRWCKVQRSPGRMAQESYRLGHTSRGGSKHRR